MHYSSYYQPHHHHHNHHHQQQQQQHSPHNKNSTLLSPKINRRHNRYNNDLDNDIDERIFEYNNYNTNYNLSRSYLSPSPSPIRDIIGLRKVNTINNNDNNNNINNNNFDYLNNDHKKFIDHELEDKKYVDRYEHESPTSPDDVLKLKWLDYSPRMSRLRDQRNKRLVTRLEQFELWDAEQSQKQKQFELAREQRYRNIMDRLKTQDFCLNQMRRRHESDIETSRDLEVYEDEHYYVDALDNAKPKQQGPISQFRKFQAEMDDKLKSLQDEIDSVNPRCKIEQTILPRLERTRETYSVEPDVYTVKGKRVLKRPQLNKSSSKGRYDEEIDEEELLKNYRLQNSHLYDDSKAVKFYYPCAINDADLNEEKLKLESRKLKPIIHSNYNNNHVSSIDDSFAKPKVTNNTNERKVYFEDDVRTKFNKNEKKIDMIIDDDTKAIDDELASEMVVKSVISDKVSTEPVNKSASEQISEPINKSDDVTTEITSINSNNE